MSAIARPGPPVALLVLLALLALAAGGCRLLEPDPESAEVDDPTPTPAEPPAPSEPEPADEVDAEELTATFDEIVAQVAELRQLPATEDVPLEVVTADELAAQAMDTSEDSLERLAEMEGILAALHQIPPDADLEALIEELVSLAAVGLYDHEDGRAYLVGDGEALTPSERAIVAHEVVHALQDQHFDLSRLSDLTDDPDAAMALRSVAEGDAVLAQERWARAHLSEEQQQQRRQEELAGGLEQLEALDDLPPALVESFLAPYTLGPQLVRELVGDEGWAAVDAALADPPRTMVEVLDPSLSASGFTPEPVDPGTAPAGWRPVDRLPWGAFEVLLTMDLADGHTPDHATAAAWRGGELAAWQRGDDMAVGVAWSFAEPQAARAVCDVVVDWHATVAGSAPASAGRDDGPDDALATDCDANGVRFAVAPDGATAAAILR